MALPFDVIDTHVLSLAAFLKLPFTDEERRLILAANARKLFGIED